jgi:hypothetical protein
VKEEKEQKEVKSQGRRWRVAAKDVSHLADVCDHVVEMLEDFYR